MGVTLDGVKIRQLRTQTGRSMAHVANDIGISESKLNHIELNIAQTVNIITLKRLADYFGVTTDSLYMKEA